MTLPEARPVEACKLNRLDTFTKYGQATSINYQYPCSHRPLICSQLEGRTVALIDRFDRASCLLNCIH